MLTTCPECRTTFRLGHAQLEARRGLVRCGTCQAVFNAYDTLLPEFETPSAAEEPAAPAPSVFAPEPALVEETQAASPVTDAVPFEVAPEEGRRFSPEAQREEPDDQAFVLHLSGRDAPAQPVSISQPADVPAASESAEAILLSELPTRHRIEPAGQVGRKLLSGVFGLLLVGVLVAQVAFFLRVPLLAALPELRPSLETVCESLGCRLPLAADLAAIRVESSSLETDPEQPNRASLRVSFSNRSELVQQWPYFILRLTDWKGSPLAQRAFKPPEYLPKGGAAGIGMAPRSEQEFRLDLDLSGIGASGYEVVARYP